jgi:polysaccharide export outer membrane protein/exopolysaccharide production protein ExoF
MESSEKQRRSADREIQLYKGLGERGLALAPRQATLERLAAQIEGDQREIDTLITRARQNISQAEANITKLIDDRNKDLATEQKMAAGQLQEVGQQILMHGNLLRETRIQGTAALSAMMDRTRATVSYLLSRRLPETTKDFMAQPHDSIQPGDVLTVEQSTPEIEPGLTSALGSSAAPR